MTSLAYAALWAFIFAVPWENLIIIPGVGTISRLLGMVAVALAVIASVVSGRVRRLRLVHVSALVFVIWAGISTFRSLDPKWSVARFGTYCQLLLVLWMLWELAPNVRRQRGLLVAYVLGAYVAAFATILVFRAGGSARRFVPEGYDPNDLGMILALALPMAWYLGMTHRKTVLRWVCRCYLVVGLLALGLLSSRGAMVVAMVALTIVPLSMTRLSPAKIAGAILLLVACGAVAVAYIPERSFERLGTTTSEVEGGNLGGRGKIWRAGALAFAAKPLLGYGTAGFKGAVSPIVGAGRVAHNTYLSVLVEQGLLGFVPWAMMFIAVFLQVLSLPTMERRFGLVLMASLGVAILPLTWDDRKPVWFILGILASFSDALLRERVGLARAQQSLGGEAGPVTQRLAPRPRAPASHPPTAPVGRVRRNA